MANETDIGKVGALTSKVVAFVEKQLLHARDLEEQPGYSGRARGPKFKWVSAGRRKTKGEVAIPLADEIWRRLADKLTEWAALSRKAAATEDKREVANFRARAKRVWLKMLVAKPAVPGNDAEWKKLGGIGG